MEMGEFLEKFCRNWAQLGVSRGFPISHSLFPISRFRGVSHFPILGGLVFRRYWGVKLREMRKPGEWSIGGAGPLSQGGRGVDAIFAHSWYNAFALGIPPAPWVDLSAAQDRSLTRRPQG